MSFLASSTIENLEKFSDEPFSQLLMWLVDDLVKSKTEIFDQLKSIVEEKYEKFRVRALRMLSIGDPRLGCKRKEYLIFKKNRKCTSYV